MSLSAALTKEAVLVELLAVMKSQFGLSAEHLQPETRLIDDLDLDSIDFVDLAVTVEESTGLVLEEQELKSIRTVQDAVDLIHAGLVGNSVTPE